VAIPDLLWACPRCGLDRGLRSAPSRPIVCAACGTRFDRVRGAHIRARSRDGEEEIRTAAGWVDALPDAAALLRADPIRTGTVRARFVDRWEVVRVGGRYVNRIEIFGEERAGRLELGQERLTWRGEGEGPVVWEFGDLRAVQASSRSLQINGPPHPLASFSFVDDSSFLWEQLLTGAIGAWYRRAGRGEIVELQPRIVAR
jgi:hypothetical protein